MHGQPVDNSITHLCLAAIATVEKAGYSALNSKPTQEPPYFAALIGATVNTPSPNPKASKDATCLVWKPSERFGIIHPHIGYNTIMDSFGIWFQMYSWLSSYPYPTYPSGSLQFRGPGRPFSGHPGKRAQLRPLDHHGLVVSTHLKNISQNGNLPQIGVKIEKKWNHHLE